MLYVYRSFDSFFHSAGFKVLYVQCKVRLCLHDICNHKIKSWIDIKQQPIIVASSTVVMAQGEVKLQPDRPFLKVLHNGRAELECCYNATKLLDFTWYIRVQAENITLDPTIVNISELVTARTKKTKDGHCSILTFSSVQLNDTGLYLCWLNNSNINLFTYGTYLHVYSECLCVYGGGRGPNCSGNQSEMLVGVCAYVCV